MLASIRLQLRARDSQRLAMIATAATCGVLLIWAAAATFSALQASRSLAQANARVQYLSEEAKASQLSLLRSGELHRVFGQLHPYQRNASNYVNQRYLHRFEICENTIAVFLINDAKRPVRHNYEIRFLNAFGFVTGIYRDSRPNDTLAAGAESVSEGQLQFHYGEPLYYAVAFLNEPEQT